MYTPDRFRVDDLAQIHDFIQTHSFATLVTNREGGPLATHVPLLFRPNESERGCLYGHVARANEHWQVISKTPQVLAIFHGPHAYISPSWYTTDIAVPTWNYVSIHAYGNATLIEEPEAANQLLDDLIDKYESSRRTPWTPRLPEADRQRLVQAIVCFRIEVTRLEAQYKLSQNRSEIEVQQVIQGLQEESGHARAPSLASFMKRWHGDEDAPKPTSD